MSFDRGGGDDNEDREGAIGVGRALSNASPLPDNNPFKRKFVLDLVAGFPLGSV